MKRVQKNIINAIEYLKQNPTTSMTKAGNLFNTDRHTISKYIKDDLYLNYYYQNQTDKNDTFVYSFSQEELDFIELYLSNPSKPYNEINLPNFQKPSRRALYNQLKILGKEKTEGGTITYHYDRTKFSEIKTEEDAYWLGFITADGCIIAHRWLTINLAEKDREHLVKFCHYIGLNDFETSKIISSGFGGAYTKDNPVNGVKICSIEIINNLMNKGVTPRKSGKEKPYICPTKELELAYIRGLIDGDGYIGNTQFRFGIVGSYEICNYVKNFITENIKNISNNQIHEHGTIYKLEINGKNQSAKILKALYNNANIYLERKYKLYTEKYK